MALESNKKDFGKCFAGGPLRLFAFRNPLFHPLFRMMLGLIFSDETARDEDNLTSLPFFLIEGELLVDFDGEELPSLLLGELSCSFLKSSILMMGPDR